MFLLEAKVIPKSDRKYKVTDWVQDTNSCFVKKMRKKSAESYINLYKDLRYIHMCVCVYIYIRNDEHEFG